MSSSFPKGTGRRPSPDPRDKQYLLPRKASALTITKRFWAAPGPVLDQGDTSQCVVYACDKYLTSSPIRNKGFGSAEGREAVYKEVQRLDEWPGEDYDGTSVRAMMKWLKNKGFIGKYSWAFDCATVISHVLTTGPLEMGTIWDAGMSNPDRWGFIEPNGTDHDDQGHAWTIVGVDREKKRGRTTVGAVRMINSWGRMWGQGGRAWITFDALDKLLRADGEASCAEEIKLAHMSLSADDTAFA
jgi:C1A family cysteine protease